MLYKRQLVHIKYKPPKLYYDDADYDDDCYYYDCDDDGDYDYHYHTIGTWWVTRTFITIIGRSHFFFKELWSSDDSYAVAHHLPNVSYHDWEGAP
jgi:hypothetical protein